MQHILFDEAHTKDMLKLLKRGLRSEKNEALAICIKNQISLLEGMEQGCSLSDLKKTRKPDPYYDAAAKVTGLNPNVSAHGGRLGKLVKHWKELGHKPEDFERWIQTVWKPWNLPGKPSPEAIIKHGHKLTELPTRNNLNDKLAKIEQQKQALNRQRGRDK